MTVPIPRICGQDISLVWFACPCVRSYAIRAHCHFGAVDTVDDDREWEEGGYHKDRVVDIGRRRCQTAADDSRALQRDERPNGGGLEVLVNGKGRMSCSILTGVDADAEREVDDDHVTEVIT